MKVTEALNKIATLTGSADKNEVISVAIKGLIEVGMPTKDAFDLILGAGAYEKMAGMIYDELNAKAEPKKFEAGKEYSCRSICDSECVFPFTILKRTKSTVTLKHFNETHRRKVNIDDDGNEWVFPLGQYSMAPILRAGK